MDSGAIFKYYSDIPLFWRTVFHKLYCREVIDFGCSVYLKMTKYSSSLKLHSDSNMLVSTTTLLKSMNAHNTETVKVDTHHKLIWMKINEQHLQKPIV